MKKLLNTLYVTTEGASLRKDGENLVAELEKEERARVPLHMLASVVVFGGIYISPALMQACAAGALPWCFWIAPDGSRLVSKGR